MSRDGSGDEKDGKGRAAARNAVRLRELSGVNGELQGWVGKRRPTREGDQGAVSG